MLRTGGLLLLAVLVLGPAAGCKRKPAPKPTPPPVVKVMPVIQRDEPIYQEWIGSLDGSVNAQIRAQVTGYLRRQAYVDGARVKKGDLLFEIDPRTFEAALGQVQAAYDRAVMDLQRATKLAAENAAAQQDRDNAQHAFDSAKAALDAARLNLDFTRITSPIDGIAGVATAQIGDLVGPGTGVLTTVSTVNPIKANFAISEQTYLDFREPKPGQPRFPEQLAFELILADGSVYPPKGAFYAIDRQVDPNTGTLRVVALFPNPEMVLRPGEYARVRAMVRMEKNALLVPQRAVSELQGTYQVITVDPENKAHTHAVELGDRVGTLWIVEKGLKPGDRIVVEGTQKARDGTIVNPEAYAAAPETSGTRGGATAEAE